MMVLPSIYWPLQSNLIRRKSVGNTFGMVRSGGTRAHQGWDLLAYPGTRCFAIADGEVASIRVGGDYGKTIVLRFQHGGRVLFAAYAHLSVCLVSEGSIVTAGQWIGLSGNTGNADTMEGDDQHLHFEIRTFAMPGKGLGGRLDPKLVYGFVPLNGPVFDSQSSFTQARAGISGPGLKVRGLNVL